MAWAFQRNSELAECFNYHLQKMSEAGILDKLHSTYVDVKSKDELGEEDNNSSLGYRTAAFPSLVLLGGLTLSVFQLMAESLWNRMKRRVNLEEFLMGNKMMRNGGIRRRTATL